MRYLKICFLSTIILFGVSLYGQNTRNATKKSYNTKTFIHLGKELGNRESEAIRQSASDSLSSILVEYAKQKDIDLKSLDKIPNMGVLHTKDVLICSWAVKEEFGTFSYYGFIRKYDKKTDSVQVFILHEDSKPIADPEFKTLTPDKWIGAIYYKMIPVTKNKRTYYTLLGWAGYNMLIKKKYIDVLYFKDDNAFFGYPLFKKVPDKRGIMRFVFQYTSKAIMSLKYQTKKKAIVFNQLESESNKQQDMNAYNGPLLQFNALLLKKDHWVFEKDFDARLKKSKNDRFYHDPR